MGKTYKVWIQYPDLRQMPEIQEALMEKAKEIVGNTDDPKAYTIVPGVEGGKWGRAFVRIFSAKTKALTNGQQARLEWKLMGITDTNRKHWSKKQREAERLLAGGVKDNKLLKAMRASKEKK